MKTHSVFISPLKTEPPGCALAGIAILLMLFASGCKKTDESIQEIRVENSTGKTVMVTAGCTEYGMPLYPHTLLPAFRPTMIRIPPFDYDELETSKDWEKLISHLPSDTLSIYIFDAVVVDTWEWSQIKEEYKLLKRMDVTIESLAKNRYIVRFH